MVFEEMSSYQPIDYGNLVQLLSIELGEKGRVVVGLVVKGRRNEILGVEMSHLQGCVRTNHFFVGSQVLAVGFRLVGEGKEALLLLLLHVEEALIPLHPGKMEDMNVSRISWNGHRNVEEGVGWSRVDHFHG